jgi:hypothetical protein
LADETEEEKGGLIRRLAEAAATRTGAVVIDDSRLELLEAESEDRRLLRREMDLIAWRSLDYMGGRI